MCEWARERGRWSDVFKDVKVAFCKKYESLGMYFVRSIKMFLMNFSIYGYRTS